jgi:uncharacterized phage infection (PIP) family protein YhgE
MSRRLSYVAAATLGIALTLTSCSSSDNGSSPNASPGASTGSSPAGTSAAGQPSGGGAASPEPSAPPPQPSNGDPVKWVDNLCAPIGDFTKSITAKAADLGSATDQTQVQAKLGQLVDDMANGIGGLIDRLKQLEPSPIKGADDAKAKMIESYGKSQQVLKDAAGKMKAGDQDAAAQVMQGLSDETSKIADPFKDNNNAELKDAMGKAPRCKDIAGG